MYSDTQILCFVNMYLKVRAGTLLLFDGDCKSASVGYLLAAHVNGPLILLSGGWAGP